MLPPLTSTLKRSSKGFQILKMSLVETARGTSFLQRKTSVLKEKLKDAYSKESLTKHPSFVSYTDEQGKGHEEEYLTSKLQLVVVKEEYNQGPANDRPPSYFQVTKLDIPPPPPFPVDSPPAKEGEGKREVCFTQDFTALENYLKKKLSVKSKLNGSSRDSFLEATKVFEWLQELPKGNNLEEFLGVYGIPVDHVDLTELRSKLKDAWKDQLDQVKDKKSKKSATEPGWKRQVEDLEDLARGDNLEKWIESLDVPYFKPLPETKREIRKYLSTHHSRQDTIEDEEPGTDLPDARVASSVPENAVQEREEKKVKFLEPQTPKWKILIERMRELKDADELDKWLDSLNVPNHVPRAKAKAEIRKFFMHETWQSYKGKSIIYQEGTVANELWKKFGEAHPVKQVAVVSATTVALGVLLALGATLLSFAIPGAFIASPFFAEVFSELFVQRQEVAFNLLSFHAENAKPMSTAWANQYVLWKYC